MSDNKSKKQIVYFKGQCRWACVPPRKARPPHKDGLKDENRDDLYHSIEVECDEEKFKKLKKAGIPKLTELREDEETGKTYIRIKATKVKTMSHKGKENMEFNDIQVVDKYKKPFTENIGNGSVVNVAAELAPMKLGTVLRLKGVQVLEHVPYQEQDFFEAVEEPEKEEDEDDDDNMF